MYKETAPTHNNIQECVQRLSDKTFIPFVDGNTDYEEYKKWLAEGNTPEPADQDE